MVTTARLRTQVLTAGKPGGHAVLFLHGNVSAATWWEEVLVSLPPGFWGIAPDQRGFGEADPDKKIDATRGLGDLVDDALALLDHFEIECAHVVGHSMGGSVLWQFLMEHPQRAMTATLVAPGSPFGFGGTKDITGTPCHDDFAGSGAGLIVPRFLQCIMAGDRTDQSPFSPRAVFRRTIIKPPFVPVREDALIEAMLAIHAGEKDYPGDTVPSPNWPYTAPGRWGINNALSPKHASNVAALYRISPKISILWVRGSDDLVVSDRAIGDPGTWGPMGLVPNYPGPEVYPPQPMLAQTRAILDQYAAWGGTYKEVVIEGSGHVPFIENLEAFNAAFHAHLA